jgi:hypothetical protein
VRFRVTVWGRVRVRGKMRVGVRVRAMRYCTCIVLMSRHMYTG